MAMFSSVRDVSDPVLQGISQEEDHAAAERQLRRVLLERGIDPDQIEDTELLRDMSVAWACMLRCGYQVRQKGDAYDMKAQFYRNLWEDGLKRLDKYQAAGEPNPNQGKTFVPMSLKIVRG